MDLNNDIYMKIEQIPDVIPVQNKKQKLITQKIELAALKDAMLNKYLPFQNQDKQINEYFQKYVPQ